MDKNYTTVIKAKTGWFDIDIKELIQYKDLIFLFVKRNYMTRYKQTVLGPLWLIINPLLTVALHSFVFGGIAGLSTDGSPQLLFYMVSNAMWSYFAACLSNTSRTFTGNAGIFGKVYFPRLVMPISTVVTACLDLIVQIGMLAVAMIIYMIKGTAVNTNISILLIPVLTMQIALLGLGCGIIISSMTTKYRDLAVLVGFGVQLWMYGSPVVYSVSQVPEKFYAIYMLNPVAPIMSMWRYAFLGIGEMPLSYWGISWCVTLVILGIGVILFSRIEKTFMDTV